MEQKRGATMDEGVLSSSGSMYHSAKKVRKELLYEEEGDNMGPT